MGWYGYGWRPYVSVAQRQANATREMAKLAKKGQTISPVKIEGRRIAQTFWGEAWCDNLESYSDFENRLPRGRTYVRNGSVVDLQIEPGQITARVAGSDLYRIKITIKPLSKPHWRAISSQCAGKITSVLELLQGKMSKGVMAIMTDRENGLFPKPAEISLDCSCPDWADMCKHVAAALYGVGARLDEKPELLFVLRQVDHLELIEQAAAVEVLAPAAGSDKKTIAESDLADVFGIEMDGASGTTRACVTAGAGVKARRRSKASTASRGPVVANKVAATVRAKSQKAARGKARKRLSRVEPKGQTRRR